MMNQAAAMKIAQGMREKGETVTPNVEVVRMMGVQLVSGRIPQAVRRELQGAVKAGRLGHLKKEGLLPEAFFHPNSKGHAITLRERDMRESVGALRKVFAPPSLTP